MHFLILSRAELAVRCLFMPRRWRYHVPAIILVICCCVYPDSVFAGPRFAPPVNPLAATCAEGTFLHIQSNICLRLQTTYGFDEFPEPQTEVRLQSCAVAELRDAVSEGNRKVILPKGCTYELGNQDLRLKDNTIIQGAGVDETLFTCSGTTAFRIHDVSNVIVRNLTVDGLNNERSNKGCSTLIYIDFGADNVLVERLRLRNGLGKGVGFRTATRVTVRYSWVERMWNDHGLNADKRFENIAYYSNYITNVGQSDGNIGYGINSHAAKAEIAGNYVENTDSGVKLMGARYTLFHHNSVIGASASNPLYRGVWTAIDNKDNVLPVGIIYYANFIDTGGVRPFSVLDGAMDIYFAGNGYGNVSNHIPVSKGSTVYQCADTTDSVLTGDLKMVKSRRITFPDSGMGEFDPCSLNRPDASNEQGHLSPFIIKQPGSQYVSEGNSATLSVSALGSTPLTYQWQIRFGSGKWINIYNATDSFYTPRVLTQQNNVIRYRVRISNEFGEVLSDVVTISGSHTSACSTASDVWKSGPLSLQSEQFRANFSATPSAANIDGLIGLSKGESKTFSDLAVIVRFAKTGYIEARDGSEYRADTTVRYDKGATYQFRMEVDVGRRLYNVYVTSPGGSELRLAMDYKFRNEQRTVTSLDSWNIWDGIGELAVCEIEAY